MNTAIMISIVIVGVLFLLAIVLNSLKSTTQPEAKLEAEPPKPMANLPVQQPIETQDDLELIAVITAAIAASLNTSTDKLVVRSFRKVSSWSTAAKQEYLKK